MKRSELLEMPLSELRTIAKNAGLKAERTWKKDDFVKMILKAEKAAQKKKAKKVKKSAENNTAAKKITEKKSIDKKPSVKKAAQKKVTVKKNEPQKSAAKNSLEKSKARKTAVTTTSRKKSADSAPKTQAAVSKSSADISSLTVTELKLIAKECGIKIKKEFKKTDIIKAISKAKNRAKAKPQITPLAPVVKEPVAIPAKNSSIDLDAYRPTLYKELFPSNALHAEMPDMPELDRADRLTAMIVNPEQLFVFWEIVGRVLGSLNLRIIDRSTGAFFFVPVYETASERIVNVKSGCVYDVEIGTIAGTGKFSALARSNAAKTPPEHVTIEALKEGTKLPAKFFRTPLPKGSY